tara:strand:+ start:30120 stop:33362 length:3243 start_codon:yes stop_codon:yes gene_type:complete
MKNKYPKYKLQKMSTNELRRIYKSLIDSRQVFTDEQCDTYPFIDASCPLQCIEELGYELGDINGDGFINVVDLIVMVQNTLGDVEYTPCQQWAADVNQDNTINVLDIINQIQNITTEPLIPDYSKVGRNYNGSTSENLNLSCDLTITPGSYVQYIEGTYQEFSTGPCNIDGVCDTGILNGLINELSENSNGGVVCFSQDSFEFETPIELKSNIILKGEVTGPVGEPLTQLWFNSDENTSGIIVGGEEELSYIHGAPITSITENYITIDGDNNFNDTGWIVIEFSLWPNFINYMNMEGDDWENDETFTLDTGAPVTYNYKKQIDRIEGNKLYFKSPLPTSFIKLLKEAYEGGYHHEDSLGTNYFEDNHIHRPKVRKLAGGLVENVGIMDLNISNANRSYDEAWKNNATNIIYFNNVVNSWIENVHSFAPSDYFVGVDTSGEIGYDLNGEIVFNDGVNHPWQYQTWTNPGFFGGDRPKGDVTTIIEEFAKLGIVNAPVFDNYFTGGINQLNDYSLYDIYYEAATDMITYLTENENLPLDFSYQQGHWQRHIQSVGINIVDSANITIKNCILKNPQNRGQNSNGYLFLSTLSNDILFKNCEGHRGRHNFTLSQLNSNIVVSGCKSIGGWQFSKDKAFGRDMDYWSRALKMEVIGLGAPGLSDTHRSFNHNILFTNSEFSDGLDISNRGELSGGAGITSINSTLWNLKGFFSPGNTEGINNPNNWRRQSYPGLSYTKYFNYDEGQIWTPPNSSNFYYMTTFYQQNVDMYEYLSNSFNGLLVPNTPIQNGSFSILNAAITSLFNKVIRDSVDEMLSEFDINTSAIEGSTSTFNCDLFFDSNFAEMDYNLNINVDINEYIDTGILKLRLHIEDIELNVPFTFWATEASCEGFELIVPDCYSVFSTYASVLSVFTLPFAFYPQTCLNSACDLNPTSEEDGFDRNDLNNYKNNFEVTTNNYIIEVEIDTNNLNYNQNDDSYNSEALDISMTYDDLSIGGNNCFSDIPDLFINLYLNNNPFLPLFNNNLISKIQNIVVKNLNLIDKLEIPVDAIGYNNTTEARKLTIPVDSYSPVTWVEDIYEKQVNSN